MDSAVKEAAEALYGVKDAEYTWVDTVRYMGIFHEVQPARDALGCCGCHSTPRKVDWKGLGYDEDPMRKALVSARE